MVSELDFFINLPNVYPMYYKNWQEVIKSILEIISIKYPNIYVSGKQGFFMQSNLDRSIDMGVSVTKAI